MSTSSNRSISWEENYSEEQCDVIDKRREPQESSIEFKFSSNTPSTTPPTSKPRLSIKFRPELSSQHSKYATKSIIGKKRKGRDDDSEAEDEKRLLEEDKGVAGELFLLAREFMDPLLDMTLDTPQRITRDMLRLRMCIEKALKRDGLTDEEEMILREAVADVKAGLTDEELDSMSVGEERC